MQVNKRVSARLTCLAVLAGVSAMAMASQAFADTLLVGNKQGTTVQDVSTSGTVGSTFFTNPTGTTNQLYGLAEGPNGDIYAANNGNGNVYQLAPTDSRYSNSTLVNTINLGGGAAPTDIAIGNGYLFVVDRGNGVIDRYQLPANGSNAAPTPFGANGNTSSAVFVSGLATTSNGIVDAGGNLYFSNDNGSGSGGGVYEISATGNGGNGVSGLAYVPLTSATALAAGPSAGGGTALYIGTGQGDDEIYKTNLFSSSVTGTTPSVFGSTNSPDPGSVGAFGIAFGLSSTGSTVLYATEYSVSGNQVNSALVSYDPSLTTSAPTTIDGGNTFTGPVGIVYVVPEPASLSLLAVGATLLLNRRRRRT
jgi:hypothetical protein